MSKHYTNEFKAVMIKRMMAPNETAVSTLSKETGISESALYKWRLDYQTKGHGVPEASTKEKALAETAALLVLSKKWQAIWGENAVN